MKQKLLCDVDGVVADLMSKFSHWVLEHHGVSVPVTRMTKFDMWLAPELAEANKQIPGGIESALYKFLSQPNCYDGVHTVSGARGAIAELRKRWDIVFVTAMARAGWSHYANKMEWIESVAPGVPILVCPTGHKHMVKGAVGIDDRYQACADWEQHGVRGLVFRQPWSEAPANYPTYDWPAILKELC